MNSVCFFTSLLPEPAFQEIEYFGAVDKIELQNKVGKRIIQLKSEKGWSQSDFARACNKDRQSLERIENGKVSPSLLSLYEISLALEVPVSELLHFE